MFLFQIGFVNNVQPVHRQTKFASVNKLRPSIDLINNKRRRNSDNQINYNFIQKNSTTSKRDLKKIKKKINFKSSISNNKDKTSNFKSLSELSDEFSQSSAAESDVDDEEQLNSKQSVDLNFRRRSTNNNNNLISNRKLKNGLDESSKLKQLGLVDGLSKFFTPSPNKRRSRYSSLVNEQLKEQQNLLINERKQKMSVNNLNLELKKNDDNNLNDNYFNNNNNNQESTQTSDYELSSDETEQTIIINTPIKRSERIRNTNTPYSPPLQITRKRTRSVSHQFENEEEENDEPIGKG